MQPQYRLLFPLLSLLVSLLPSAPALAGHDEEVALASVIGRAHGGDPGGLLGMMSAAERPRFLADVGLAAFDRHLRALGIWTLVTCAAQHRESAPPLRLRTAASDLAVPDEYRCEIACQRGSYTALVVMSPPDPLVRLPPRSGLVERFTLASPLLDSTPWPPFPRGSARPWLIGLYALVTAVLGLGALGLSRRRVPRRGAGLPLDDEEPAPGGELWGRSGRDVLLVLRLLTVLALVPALWLWLALAPLPVWGHASVALGGLGLGLLGVGLLLCALAAYLRPPVVRRHLGWRLAGSAALLAALTAVCAAGLDLGIDLPGVSASRGGLPLGPYQLPLVPADTAVAAQGGGRTWGPAYVRRAGPVLDLVYLFGDGRSCHGAAAADCRTFGAPVTAPADGVVERVRDDRSDLPIGARGREDPEGNYVLLRHGGERTLLLHLQRGSVRVRVGQAVRRGELLARAGNSGDSDEPHIAMQRFPTPQPLPGRAPTPAWRPPDPVLWLRGYLRHGWSGTRRVEALAPVPGERVSP